VCETVWFFSWANTHPFDLDFVAFCPKFSRDCYAEFQEKNYFGRIFHKFYWKSRLSSTETCEISPYFQQFYSGSILRWKKFTQVLSYVVCTQVRSHVHKHITKRRYEEEKPGRFVFGKPVLFTLGLGLTTPYSFGILVWNLYWTFVVVSTELRLRFEPQIHPTRFAINFLFITARADRKVSLCVKLFDFIRGWILIRLSWNLSRFVPNSVEILTWNFRKKLLRENFHKFDWKPRLSSTETCEISPYFRQFNSGSVLRWKKFHTSTFICCLHPGKEARP